VTFEILEIRDNLAGWRTGGRRRWRSASRCSRTAFRPIRILPVLKLKKKNLIGKTKLVSVKLVSNGKLGTSDVVKNALFRVLSKQWPLAPNLRKWQITRANVSNASLIFQK